MAAQVHPGEGFAVSGMQVPDVAVHAARTVEAVDDGAACAAPCAATPAGLVEAVRFSSSSDHQEALEKDTASLPHASTVAHCVGAVCPSNSRSSIADVSARGSLSHLGNVLASLLPTTLHAVLF